jgi:hypothetical protein
MPLHQCLCHLELNIIVLFPELNDRQNCLADDFQYRGDLADDAFPVSQSSFFPWPSDLDPAV